VSLVYIAIAPCGCVCAADFEDGPETHALIADWIKRGYRVERVDDLEGIRFGCSHDPKWGRR